MKNRFGQLPQALVRIAEKHKWLKYPILSLLLLTMAICNVIDAAKALAHPKTRRRILASALSLCMVFTLLPATAFAAGAPEGTPIANQDGLAAITVNDSNAAYYLANDIELTGTWTPIEGFRGTLDGDGRTISGLDVAKPGKSAKGLFGSLHGTVKNLNVKGRVDANTDTGRYGGIAGMNYGSIINCTFSGKVQNLGGNNQATGGICGTNETSGKIENCVNEGEIVGTANITLFLGGIAGSNHGTIKGCTNKGLLNGDITSGKLFVGDLFGSDTWENGGGYVGGMAGDTNGKLSGHIENCKNEGYVVADNGVPVEIAAVQPTPPVVFDPEAPAPSKEELASRLPGQVVVGTENGNRLVDVTWDVENSAYDPAINGDYTIGGSLDFTDSNVTNVGNKDTSTEVVVSVGSGSEPVVLTSWEELKAAVEGAPTDKTKTTINLTKDEIASSTTFTIVIGAGKNIVIDGGTINGLPKALFEVVDGAQLTLKNFHVDGQSAGTRSTEWIIRNNKEGVLAIADGCVFENMSFTSANAIIYSFGNCRVTGGVFQNNVSTSTASYSSVGIYNMGELTITGGGFSNNKHNGKGFGAAVYNISDAKCYIFGGSFNSGNVAVSNNAGIFHSSQEAFSGGEMHLSGNPAINCPLFLDAGSAYNFIYLDDALTGNVTLKPAKYEEDYVLVKANSGYTLTEEDYLHIRLLQPESDGTWYTKLSDDKLSIVATQAQGVRLTTVYLAPVNGDDTRDGKKVTTAIKTFDRAKQLLANGGHIILVPPVTISGDELWELPENVFGDGAKVTDDGTTIIDVGGGKLELGDITIDGIDRITIGDGGTVTIGDSTVIKPDIDGKTDIVVDSGGTLDIGKDADLSGIDKIYTEGGGTVIDNGNSSAGDKTDSTNPPPALEDVPPTPDFEAAWTVTGDQETKGTFAEALVAMTPKGGSIKLLTEVSTSGQTKLPAKAIALDLNGQTWTSGGEIQVVSGGTLTITGTGVGGITAAATTGVSVQSGGTLDLQSGSISATGTSRVGISNSGTVKLSGGAVSAAANAVNNKGALYLSGTPTLTAGSNYKQITMAGSATVIANDGNTSSPSYSTGEISIQITTDSTAGYVAVSGLENEYHAKKFTFDPPPTSLDFAYDDVAKIIKLVYKSYGITYKDMGSNQYSGLNESNLPKTHTYNTVTQLVDGEKRDYSFGGWFIDSNCSEGNRVLSLGATEYTAPITLYAKWARSTPPSCTCSLEGLPPDGGYGATGIKFETQSAAASSFPFTFSFNEVGGHPGGNCEVEGHSQKTIAYTYALTGQAPANNVTITRDDREGLAQINFAAVGAADVKCTASANGKTQDFTATLTVTQKAASNAPGGKLEAPLTQEKVDKVFGEGNATPDSDKITINNDITVESPIVIKPTPITIDLGGNTITGGEGVSPVIKIDGGTGTITGGGSINGGNGGAGVEVGDGGTVIIGGGTEINGGDSSTGNGGDAINGGGSVVIGGGGSGAGGGSANGGSGFGTSGNGGDGVDVGGDVEIGSGGNATGGNGSGTGTGGDGVDTSTGTGGITISGGGSTGGSGGNNSSGTGGNGGNGTNSGGKTDISGGGSSTGGDGGSGTTEGGNGGDGSIGAGDVTNGGKTEGGSGGSASSGDGGSGGNGSTSTGGKTDISGGGSSTGGAGGSGTTGGGTGGNGAGGSSSGGVTVGGKTEGGSGGSASSGDGGYGGNGTSSSGSTEITDGGTTTGGTGGSGTTGGGKGGDGISSSGEITVADGGSSTGGSGGTGSAGIGGNGGNGSSTDNSTNIGGKTEGGTGGNGTTGGGTGGNGADTGAGAITIDGGGTATGGSGGGASSGTGGTGGNGANAGGGAGNVTVDDGGATTGGAGGSGTATGGTGGNGTSTEGNDTTTINGGTTGGNGGNGNDNGDGGKGGDGAYQDNSTDIGGSGTATGGNGGNGSGTGTGGEPGAGVGGGAGAGSIIAKPGIRGRQADTRVDDSKSGTTVTVPDKSELTDAALTKAEQKNDKITKVEVTLKVEEKKNKPDKDAVEAAMPPEADTLGTFFNITLNKIITDESGQQPSAPVTDASKKITITITIPTNMRGGSDYVVIRVHNGAGEALITTRSGDKLSFKTDKFSTYAIAYKAAGGGEDPKPPVYDDDDKGYPIELAAASGTYRSDTTLDLTVQGEYQFKITSLNGKAPVFTLGTDGVFTVKLAKQIDNDYYYVVTSVGAVGAKAGVYINGEGKLLTLTVGGGKVTSDTNGPFPVPWDSYQFLLKADAQPAIVAGSKSFKLVSISRGKGGWLCKFKVLGAKGESCGFYINGSKTPVAVATIE